MSKSILDRIRRGSPTGEGREQESEDEDVIMAKKINALDQQVNTMQQGLTNLTKEYTSTRDMLVRYVQEQRTKNQDQATKMQTVDDALKKLVALAQAPKPQTEAVAVPAVAPLESAPTPGPEGTTKPAGADISGEKVQKTLIAELMEAANMMTRSAHLVNERASTMEKWVKQFSSQIIVFSRNITEMSSRLEVIENHYGIKRPAKSDATETETVKPVDSELENMIQRAGVEADEAARAVRKKVMKEKLASSLSKGTDESEAGEEN